MNQQKQISKVLFVANTARFFVMFEQNNIKILQSMGYEVHCASNFDLERDVDAKSILENLDVKIHQIDIARSPFSMKNIMAYKQLKKLMKKECFSLIDCHTPMGGVLARLAAKTTKIMPVIYTAHGFHFYKGCPLKNRLIYETIERWLARYTDVLITINEEDCQAAQKFKVRGNVYKIPGIGIDVDKIRSIAVDKKKKRQEMGIPEDAFVILSVGDLNKNKNHRIAIEAFAAANLKNTFYLICGEGKEKENLISLLKKLGVEEQVCFLGFRKDVIEILQMSDLFVFPSIREGLGLAAIEALATGIPVVAANNRGSREYYDSSIGSLCRCDSVEDFKEAILTWKDKLKDNKEFVKECAVKKAKEFDLEITEKIMCRVYEEVL